MKGVHKIKHSVSILQFINVKKHEAFFYFTGRQLNQALKLL